MPCTYQSAFDTLWNSASLEWTRPNMHGGHLAVSFILECRTLITSHNRWFVTQTHLRSRSWKLLEILGRWLDELPVYQSQSSANFNQSDHQNIWCSMRALPAVPVGKTNSCRRQYGEERKHLFHREKPSVSLFALLSMKKDSPVLI